MFNQLYSLAIFSSTQALSQTSLWSLYFDLSHTWLHYFNKLLTGYCVCKLSHLNQCLYNDFLRANFSQKKPLILSAIWAKFQKLWSFNHLLNASLRMGVKVWSAELQHSEAEAIRDKTSASKIKSSSWSGIVWAYLSDIHSVNCSQLSLWQMNPHLPLHLSLGLPAPSQTL